MLADLHTHTTASDGQYAPAELVGLARARGLEVLAVTDHDTIAGVDEAMEAGRGAGVEVIRGVELSASARPGFHILGYGVRSGERQRSRLCEELRAGRDERKHKIVRFLREKGVELDLGAVAKGYTGDQLMALLAREGIASAIVELGGNVQALGTKPDGSPWRVAVRDPAGDGSVGVVEVVDQAVVTSGGYERYFEEDGVRYWHIIDPATGWPARSGLASVTVVGESGLLCDGLSTALFVMGREGALEHWRQHRDFEAVLVSEDGSVTITAGLEGRFTPADPARPLTVAQP